MQEAFAAALARWPLEGTPDEPRAWLISVARHKAIDTIRSRVKLRADLLRRLGRSKEAAVAYRAALARVGSEPERRFLERRLASLAM